MTGVPIRLLLLFILCLPTVARAADDDPLKPFPLLERGIVVGAGLGVHAGSLGSGVSQRGAATTGFAYVGIIPAYWLLGDVTRRYCATTGSQEDRQAAANLYAAQKHYPNTSASVLEKKLAKKPEIEDPEQKVTLEPFTQEEKEAIRKSTKWDMNLPGSCAKHFTWLGLFAALPGSYTANVRADLGGAALSKEVHPYGSLGVFIAVKPYVHILGGFTFGHTAVGESDSAREQSVNSLFFGLGTTIDVVGSAFN